MKKTLKKATGCVNKFRGRILRKVRGFFSKSMVEWYYYRRIEHVLPELKNYKKATIYHMSNRSKELGCKDLRQYYKKLRNDPEEQNYMKSNLTLKGTHFFRGEDWDYFRERCLSAFKGRKKLKLWCAGCSSGEEVYSLIMALLDYVPITEIDVLATDYNDDLLEKCKRGEYGDSHYAEIPERYRKYLKKGPKRFSVLPELTETIHVKNLNLLTDPFPTGFDVILCRNVLKFFSPQKIAQIQEQLAYSLNRGGFLFLSADDHHCDLEFIDDPASMGLEQMDDRCIYRKPSAFET